MSYSLKLKCIQSSGYTKLKNDIDALDNGKIKKLKLIIYISML
jgi:hypothetical protein